MANIYNLDSDFADKKDCMSYLISKNFMQDKIIESYWYNKFTDTTAHMTRVRELNGSETYLATYYNKNIEAGRETLAPARKDITRVVIPMQRNGVHYG